MRDHFVMTVFYFGNPFRYRRLLESVITAQENVVNSEEKPFNA